MRSAGKRVLVTGATGFIGTAIVERVLASLPETRLVLLIRGRGNRSAVQRARELLDEHAFRPLRERWGDAELRRTFADTRRIEIVEADFAVDEFALPSDLDCVVHCAADTAFDRAIDVAFTTNVVGCERLYAALIASGSRPHLVHVSTAYVAGLRRGPVLEGPAALNVSWKSEVDAVAGLRGFVELESRLPDVLEHLTREAQAAQGRSNPSGVARASRRCAPRVGDAQIGRRRAGAARARSDFRISTASPRRSASRSSKRSRASTAWRCRCCGRAITESALIRPYPGWIKGFKMAEPIIHAYGRGDLAESPAGPRQRAGRDASRLCRECHSRGMRAATGRTSGLLSPGFPELAIHSVSERSTSSGVGISRRIRLTTSPRRNHPWRTGRFPAVAPVERRLKLAERATDVADAALSKVPHTSATTRRWADALDAQRRRLQTSRRLFDLFGTYVSAEMTFLDDATQRLYASLSTADRVAFDFDCRNIDWRHYLVDVHLPAVRRGAHTSPRLRSGAGPRPEP